jgi:hypothetical protein
MGGARAGDQVAETGGEQCPCHLGEGEQQKGPSAEGIDGPDGGPCEREVDEAETPAREE